MSETLYIFSAALLVFLGMTVHTRWALQRNAPDLKPGWAWALAMPGAFGRLLVVGGTVGLVAGLPNPVIGVILIGIGAALAAAIEVFTRGWPARLRISQPAQAMMKWLEVLERYRPLEVYVGAVVCYLVLFMNSPDFFFTRMELEYFFDTRQSIVYGLIRGIGDDHLHFYAADVLYWFLSILYVGLVLIKARRISRWLWNEG